MYISYYNLKAEPFTISVDPKFLWQGEKHKEALATLRYGILANKGFLLLTGDVGTGKTTLINALENSLRGEIVVATVYDPGLEKIDFYNFVANAFKIDISFKSKGYFLYYFSRFLKETYSKNKKVLLIIDEAQRLNSDLLEEIRLLSNIELQHTKLINIFFVGQNEFNETLLEKENRAIRQRITLIHSLGSLNERETKQYIQHRLQIAGANKKIFNSGAFTEIYSFTGGYPRLINIICDYALLTGYVKEKKTINAKIIKECAEELRIPIKSFENENKELKSIAAADPKDTPTARKWISWRKAGYIILLLLLFVAAGFLYQQKGLDGSVGFIKTYWGNVINTIKNTDISSGQQAGQILKNKPGVMTDKVASNGKRQQKLQTTSQPDQTPILKEKELKTDNVFKKVFIYFDDNSYIITDETVKKLDRIATVLNQNPYSGILIKVYTDRGGRFSYNKKLSEFRAAIVKSYLVGKGVDPKQAKAFSMGPEKPDENKGAEKPAQLKRRVEIEFNFIKPE